MEKGPFCSKIKETDYPTHSESSPTYPSTSTNPDFVTVPTSGLVQLFRDINPTKSNIYSGEKRSQNLKACHPFLFANMVWVILQQQLHKPLVRLLWLRLLVAKNSYFTHNIAKNFWCEIFMKRFRFRSLTRLTL